MKTSLNELKNYKRNLLAISGLAATMTLAGCGNSKTNIATTPTQEPTTQVTTEFIIEEVDYTALASESWDKYAEYYATSSMGVKDEETGKWDITRVENMFKLLNDDVEELTPTEISTAIDDIKRIEMQDDLIFTLDKVKNPDIEIQSVIIYDTPKLSEYIQNPIVKAKFEEHENNLGKVQSELVSNKSVSDETKEILRTAVVKDAENNRVDSQNLDRDVTLDTLLENIIGEARIQLYTNTTRESFVTIYGDEQLQIVPLTDEERDLINRYISLGGVENLSDEDKVAYTDLVTRVEIFKYQAGICAGRELMERKSKGYKYTSENVSYELDLQNWNAEKVNENEKGVTYAFHM